MNLTTSIPFARKLFTREAFMTLFILSVGGVLSVLLGIPIVGFFLSPLIETPTYIWRDIGALSDYKIGETVQVNYLYPSFGTASWSGPTQQTAAWVRRNGLASFEAFAVYCTHLGCPVHWLQIPKLFICPCHGSVFNGDGTVAGGPAPRPLFRYDIRVVNGRVQIKTAPQPETT
jgi:menaquinol-cytochrome c reductase iron-sulfur subunit